MTMRAASSDVAAARSVRRRDRVLVANIGLKTTRWNHPGIHRRATPRVGSVRSRRSVKGGAGAACRRFTFHGPGATHQRRANGSTSFTPDFSKSARFRVATVSPCLSAVAAMRLSLIGIARPAARSVASSCAHRRAVSTSHDRQCRRLTPVSNQCSRPVRRLPIGSRRMPKRTSPRMMGSTTRSRSWVLSQSTATGSGVALVGSLRTLAST